MGNPQLSHVVTMVLMTWMVWGYPMDWTPKNMFIEIHYSLDISQKKHTYQKIRYETSCDDPWVDLTWFKTYSMIYDIDLKPWTMLWICDAVLNIADFETPQATFCLCLVSRLGRQSPRNEALGIGLLRMIKVWNRTGRHWRHPIKIHETTIRSQEKNRYPIDFP